MGEAAQKITKVEPERLKAMQGTFSDPKHITSRLQAAAKECHLVSPQTAVGQLPPGLGVALSAVFVDPEQDTYKIPGRGDQRGLSKPALDKIAAGAGVSWDPSRSYRVDDGRDPYYCRYRVVGTVRNFDGSTTTIQAEKEMDLREGSPMCEGLHAIARKNKRPNADDQIREMRMHILSHAETKARLRAIRSLGVHTSYPREELDKPFISARVMFTGETDDPEIKKHIASRVADSFLGSSQDLYGQQPAPALQEPRRGTASPPPVGSVPADEEDFAPELGSGDSSSGYIDAPSESQQSQPAQQSAPTQQSAPAAEINPADFKVPGGKEKGKPLTEAGDGTLNYWRNKIASNLDENTCRYPEQDKKLLAALEIETDRRAKGAQQSEAAAPAQQGGDEPPPPDAPDDLFGDGDF